MFLNDGFDSFMFTGIPIFITIIFLFVIGTVLFNLITGFRQWSYNNSQPVLTVPARVVTKRIQMRNRMHHSGDNMGHHHHTSTSYFVTFEVESGDRMELRVKDQEYGMLVESDFGSLTFQGTRYLGFERQRDILTK